MKLYALGDAVSPWTEVGVGVDADIMGIRVVLCVAFCLFDHGFGL